MLVVNSRPLITAESLMVFIQPFILENGRKSIIFQCVILCSYIINYKIKIDLQILSM